MTYFTFLAVFVGLPLVILLFLNWSDRQRGRTQPDALHSWPPVRVIALLCLVAFIYTTPWDNYLVATKVWWYDPALVTGIVFGYVPIEEYTFFILLPILTGLFLLWLHKRLTFDPSRANNPRIRLWATVITFVVWVTSVIALILSLQDAMYKPLTYLSLELSWALIPIMIQLAFGADILWRHRRTVLTAIGFSTLYLSATDAIAINAGTWVIDPAQSLNWFLGGILPIEEAVFFGIVSSMVVIGSTLILAEESQTRAQALGRYALLRPLVSWIKPRVEIAQ
jgi:lycopene beta-cyclase